MCQGLDGQRPGWPPEGASVAVVARRDGPRLELWVHGEADVDTSDRLRADLRSGLDEGVREVVVDVSALTFCDLAGSDALHDFVEEVAARAVCTDVRGMSPLLAMIYRAFPPPRPAGIEHARRSTWAAPLRHDSRRGDPALEPAGGHRAPDTSGG